MSIASRAMASSLVALKDIPSISALYRSKKLEPSSKEDLPTPSQEYNNKICTLKSDITKLEVDAIVNAANTSLLGGGGVDGAIHRAAGPDLLRECRTLGGCKTGSSKITDAYRLPSKKVIHTVGPVYDSDEESEPLLRGCYKTSLQLAVENDCKSIAFSAISTGIYGYPSTSSAYAALDETRKFLERSEGQKLDKVIFCNFLDKDINAYAKILPRVFPPINDDLNHSGEYKENSIPGDKLPTSTQARPRETSEAEKPERASAIDDSSNDRTIATDIGETSDHLTSMPTSKRKFQNSSSEGAADSANEDATANRQDSADDAEISNEANGTGHELDNHQQAADDMIAGADIETHGTTKTTKHVGDGDHNMSTTDLLPDELLNIVMSLKVDQGTRSASVKETSGDRTTMTDAVTATDKDAHRKGLDAVRKEQNLDEVTIYMPKSDVPMAPDFDPTRSLSTEETLRFYLESNGTASPRRDSVGHIVPSSIRHMRCSHHFKKLGDGEAHGLWPAGKYKCTTCEMIICP